MSKQNKIMGFTIAELVLVVAIIGVLFTIGTRGYFNQRHRFIFNDSLSRIIGLIKTAKNYAITSRAAFDTRLPDDPATERDERLFIPPKGYGVHVSRSATPGGTRLTLFANTSDDGIKARQFNALEDLVEETYLLPEETNLEALLKTKDLSAASEMDEAVILFTPPLAEVFISNNGNPDTAANLIDTLFFRLSFRFAPASAPDRFIHINRNAGFPEIDL